MPVYEYQCKACQKEFEYQQRMSDPEKTTCEACGADKLERLISRTAFSLKGGGWYKDLYSSSKPESKADAPAKTESAPSSDSSSSTPAASPSPGAASGSSTPSAPAPAPSTSGGSSSGSGGSTSKSAASGAK